jgi:hypothetical protein
MIPRRLAAGLLAPLLLAAVLAGCFGTTSHSGTAGAPSYAAPLADLSAIPAGCHLDGVVVHKAGGVAASSFPGPRPVPCLHDSGFKTFEPALGITSSGAVFIGPGAAGILAGNTAQLGVLRSKDQGATWDLVYPSTAGVPTHQFTLDPYLYADPATDRVWYEDLLPAVNTALNSWTDDDGASWTHAYAGGFQTDHVSVFTGKPVTSTTLGYPNIVYRCAISAGATADFSAAIVCQRSLTGGGTWLPPGEPAYTFLPGVLLQVAPSEPGPLQACSSGNGHGFTDQKGRVYLPRGHCGQPFLAWSDDEGLTWTRKQVSDLGNSCAPAFCEHDAGVGIDSNGTLYYAWVAGDRLLYLVRSHDGGATWDAPRMIGAPGLKETTHVQLAAGGAGKVAFAYYGSTNSPGAPWTDGYEQTTWNAYMAVSYDADSDSPTFATATLNDPIHPLVRGPCGPVRCDTYHDYIDIRIGPDGAPWSPIFDDCTGTCDSGERLATNDAEALGGRLYDVDLWDAADPNGPYP